MYISAKKGEMSGSRLSASLVEGRYAAMYLHMSAYDSYKTGREAYELVHYIPRQYQRLIEMVHVREEAGEIESAKVENKAFECE